MTKVNYKKKNSNLITLVPNFPNLCAHLWFVKQLLKQVFMLFFISFISLVRKRPWQKAQKNIHRGGWGKKIELRSYPSPGTCNFLINQLCGKSAIHKPNIHIKCQNMGKCDHSNLNRGVVVGARDVNISESAYLQWFSCIAFSRHRTVWKNKKQKGRNILLMREVGDKTGRLW